MKKFILPWFIFAIMLHCAFAQTPGQAVDKNDLAEKIKGANALITRSRIETAAKTELKNIVSTETTTAYDLDSKDKVMHAVTEIKTFEFNFQDMLKTQAERSIANAKENGASPEKIEKLQKLAEGLSSGVEKALSSFQGRRYEMFLSGNDLYIRLKDGWVRSDSAQQVNFPSLLSQGKAPGSLFGTIGLERLLENIGSVSDGDCAGHPCYILGIDAQRLSPALAEALQATQAQGKNKDLRAAVTSLAITLSVAKDNYLMLSSTANAQVVLYDPIRPGYSLQQSLEEHSTYAYPEDQVRLPDELSQAVLVRDKDELKRLITQDLGANLIEGIKNAQTSGCQ
jgi:hypothetical protein